MSPLIQRVVAGMGANAFGQGVTIFIQLASLPVFLSHWDASTYGVWLMLSALASYLTMADVGMVTAAGNKMTMAAGAGDWETANGSFQSALLIIVIVCAGIAVVATPLVLWMPIPGLQDFDRRTALMALTAGVLVSLFGGLADAAFRSTGRYAVGTLCSNVLRLIEWMGCIAGLLWIGSFTAVAVGGLTARVVGQVCVSMLSTRGVHGIRWGFAAARVAEVRSNLKPAMSFMVFPLANALSFQGVTLLVGQLLGPAAVAAFNTYRTLARVTVQLTSIFSFAIWPEVSRLYGLGDQVALQRVYGRALVAGAIFAVGSSAAMYFASPWLLAAWARNVIPFDAPVVAMLLVYAGIGSLWHVPRVLLMATNQHAALALWYAVTSGLGLFLVAYGALAGGLLGVACAVLVTEVLIAAVCAANARVALSSPSVAPRALQS